jgi:hypothetical protein
VPPLPIGDLLLSGVPIKTANPGRVNHNAAH